MKKTSTLQLIFNHHQPKGVIFMHPNAGFELNLMTKSHEVAWFNGMPAKDFLSGAQGEEVPMRIDLLNECPHNQIQLHASHMVKLGEAKKAVVFLDGHRFFIHTL